MKFLVAPQKDGALDMEVIYRDFEKSDKGKVQILALQLINYIQALDSQKIAKVGENYISKYWQKLEQTLKKHEYKFLVAEYGSKVIGYCLVVIELSEEVSAYAFEDILPIRIGDIYDICVDERYRGFGLGSQLMKLAEEWMKKKNCDYAWLQVFDDNFGAKKLYSRLGYKNRISSMMKKLTS